MISNIDIHSSVAVYVQIANQVQFAISSGQLKPGNRLPSVRELAERLAVNPNTVAKSYRDLETMGLLYTRRGMGVYVNRNVEQSCAEQCRRQIIARFYEVIAEAKAAGMPRKDLMAIADASFAIDAPLYGKPPGSLMALATPKK